jgi:23S rRNA G2445 N2-methylase RlmL
VPNSPRVEAVDRLRLLGVTGSSRILDGELRRIVRRAFEREAAEALLDRPAEKIGPAAIGVPFSPQLAALLATYHRTGARLLWDLYEFEETRLEPLYEAVFAAVSADPRPFLDALPESRRVPITVETSSNLPIEANPRQVVGAVKNALTDAARAKGLELIVDPERPALSFSIRAYEARDGYARTTLSLDVAGRPLHERGYRTQGGDAPLREDLAALLVMLARFDARSEALIDPLSGSGTIAIEAALMAQGKPIWTSGRKPQLAEHPLFRDEFTKFRAPLYADTEPAIFTWELDAETALLQERAIKTAGVEPFVQLGRGDFRDLDPVAVLDEVAKRGKAGGVLLTNPPYGGRLNYDERELLELYQSLYDLWRSLPGFRVALLVGEPDNPDETPRIRLIEKAFRGRARVHKPLKNGPMRASFLLYDESASAPRS